MITGIIYRNLIRRQIVEHRNDQLPNRAEAEQWLTTALDLHQHNEPMQSFTGQLVEYDYDPEDELAYIINATNIIADPLDQLTWDTQPKPAA